MQLGLLLALALLLASPAMAQMPTHPPIDDPKTLATGQIPAAARSAVEASVAVRASRGVPAAAKDDVEARKGRDRIFDDIKKKRAQ